MNRLVPSQKELIDYNDTMDARIRRKQKDNEREYELALKNIRDAYAREKEITDARELFKSARGAGSRGGVIRVPKSGTKEGKRSQIVKKYLWDGKILTVREIAIIVGRSPQTVLATIYRGAPVGGFAATLMEGEK